MFNYLSRIALRRLAFLSQKGVFKQMTMFLSYQTIYAAGKRTRILIPALAFGFKSKESASDIEKKILTEADKLFDDYKIREVSDLIETVDSWESNPEFLWRMARCRYHFLKYRTDKMSDEYMKIMKSALECAQKTVKLNPECGPGHKWIAIILDEYACLHGTKARISQLLNIREHMEKAIQYSPTDPTCYYLLGEWHYSCASVSWIERNMAKVLFGELPEASYEIALENFEKAEKLEEYFYSRNTLGIARTLLALDKDKERAIALLKNICQKYKDSVKWDDSQSFIEARKLLYKLGEINKYEYHLDADAEYKTKDDMQSNK